MLISQSRPRVLGWHHAGPLLFGDWGTSRLYVLGLAFFYAGHASVGYMAAVGVLMLAVAWAYTVVCRSFPDGGGVYAAARELNPTLAVIGSTLLLCGYIITVVISLVEAWHYMGIPSGPGGSYAMGLSIGAIVLLGVVNWLGARSAGRFAAGTAVAAIGASLVLALLCLPFVPAGLRTISWHSPFGPWDGWVVMTKLCLAMAGVEAVANMAGLMKQPVARTAKRTIWPVAAEVTVLNLVFVVALAGLPALAAKGVPDWMAYERAGLPVPADVIAYRDTGLKVLAEAALSHWFGTGAWTAGLTKVTGIVFGLLLISAANTALLAMVSVFYALAQDRELPKGLQRLNYSGVPWIGLILSCAACVAVLVVERDVARLGEMYVIGVCGAVTTNILSCAWNRKLSLSRVERGGMWGLGMLLLTITITIAVTKLNATLFASATVGLVLMARMVSKRTAAAPAPEVDWLAEVRKEPLQLDPSKPRIMLAARGRHQAEFAVDMARRRGATLFAIYVRTLRVIDMRPGALPRVEDDKAAQESLGTVAMLARQHGVPFVPIYVSSPNIAEEILDYTVTYGCDTLILGKSLRRVFARQLEGDVVMEVARHLPDGVALITRDATPHPMMPVPGSTVGTAGAGGGGSAIEPMGPSGG
ncbi:MAG: amino acid permease [Phycisphaerae bacterium]|nr:amino acid permease [Phycisphaerae bacterium]